MKQQDKITEHGYCGKLNNKDPKQGGERQMGKWRKWDEDSGGEMWDNMVSRNRGWNKK